MKASPPKELIVTWFDRVWNQLDGNAVRELMNEDGEILGLGTTVVDPEGFIRILRLYRAAFDQIHLEVVDLVEDDSSVAGHARFSGIHRQSTREVDFLFSFAARCEGNRLSWIRHVVDFTALLSQIGTLDPRAVNMIFEA